MPGFADSFWSNDYAAGLAVLFGKLQQGVIENRQVLTIARMRAEAEELYGARLGDIAPAADKITGGFSRDDGATVRKAYDGMRTEMEEAAKSHRKIAQSVRDLVVNPFSRWCDAHEARVQASQDELLARIKANDRQADSAKKLRATYFNKCRLVEDLEEENKLAFQDPETTSSPKAAIPEIKVSPNKDVVEEDLPYDIGDESFSPEQVKKILLHMLNNIPLVDTKVPILGTYQNTSAGAEIVDYFQKNMGSTSVSHAERVGQDLVSHGFLRLVGNVGNTFANSSRMFYQWRPKAFQFAGMPEKKTAGLGLARTFSMPVDSDSPTAVGSVGEYLANWNPLNNPYPNETPAQRLQREAAEADDKYKASVLKLDEMRCELEESIFVHLRFMERCELDRLKAIKTVILDFSGTISNAIPSLQSTVDNMMLFQETVQPLSDLRYLLENYRTGSYIPRVVVYENYYNKIDVQTFGVDVEARARADKKRVPLIVTSILSYLDDHYPDLEGDEIRRGVWLADVPLSQTHRLRAQYAASKSTKPEAVSVIFDQFDIPTVASLLKIYLLELPDSLVSSHVYEIIRTIYNTPGAEAAEGARVPVLVQTLSQLRLINIATLDACMNHFTRLIDLTSADEAYVVALATMLGPCVIRPRTETSLTLEEKHPYRLVRDLFSHKEDIFSELKRLSTATHSPTPDGATPRPRAISTDESNRKAHMEERNRLLLEKASGSRGRATSPAPGPRHRRDRSAGGPETRFPVHASSPISSRINRQSLDVPDSDGAAVASPPEPITTTTSNGHYRDSSPPATLTIETPVSTPTSSDKRSSTPTSTPGGHGPADKRGSVAGTPVFDKRSSVLASPIEKRNSLGRSGARFGSGRRVHGTTSSLASISHSAIGGGADDDDTAPRGVQLEDKPMDD